MKPDTVDSTSQRGGKQRPTLDRKSFLKTSAGMVGASVLGLSAVGAGGAWLFNRLALRRGNALSNSIHSSDPIMTAASAFDLIANPTLATVHPAWAGTPLDEQGRFMNHEYPFIQGFDALLRWKLGKNPQEEQKRLDPWRIPVEDADGKLGKDGNKVIPLGHASFFIQLAGLRVLIDPVFYDLPGGLRRLSKLPVNPEQLRNIDYLLISHAHYDHCDRRSITQLAKQNPGMQILTGLKMTPLLRGWAAETPVQEAGWYQSYEVKDGLEIVFLPTRHWSNRFPWDVNTRLWGGFWIRGAGRTLYFNGDSGYGSHYKDVQSILGPVDLALLGAGAYSPRWFMKHSHQDPQQAAQAFVDLGAKRMLPFHYGTFDLSDEPPSESEVLLRQESSSGGWKDRLLLPVLGRPVEI